MRDSENADPHDQSQWSIPGIILDGCSTCIIYSHTRVKEIFAQMKRAEHARRQGGANVKRAKAHGTMIRGQRAYRSSVWQWYFGPVHGR